MSSWSIDFTPMLPGPYFWAAVVLAAALALVLLLRRNRGAVLRALSLATLLLALANPTLRQEERESLANIAIVVIDESTSQTIAGRPEQTADHPLADDPRHLLPARIPVVLLGLLTILATAQIAARAAGPAAGWAAAAAAALCPDVVAHSGLATLDIPVTAFATLAALLAWRWVRERSAALLVGFAVSIGAACLVKSSALHLFAAMVVASAFLPGRTLERLGRAGALLGAGAAAIVVGAWLAYGAGPAIGLLPAQYVAGLAGKFGQGAQGHFSYLLGQVSENGFPHYYLVALAAKTPLALQALLLVGLVGLVRRRLSGDASGFVAFVLVPALWLFAAMSWLHRVHIGVRHVLPAYPAALVLAGAGAAALAAGGPIRRIVLGVLAAWMIVAAARITPDQLAYFNELAGGPDRGDAILIDSNLDWGQDEGRFREWALGRAITVNPDRPTAGLVAANVNALRGIFSTDDLRLRWLRRLAPERTFGHSIRVYRVTEAPLRDAAARDSVAALDYAWWLWGTGRASEASTTLDRIASLGEDPVHGREYWKVRGEALLAQNLLDDALEAAERSQDADLVGEIDWRRRAARGATVGAAEGARAVRALARRGHREEASRLGIAVFGRDPLVATSAAGPRWSEAGRLKALGLEREALEVVGRALAHDPANDDALWLYGELVGRRKLRLTGTRFPTWTGGAWRAECRARRASRRGASRHAPRAPQERIRPALLAHRRLWPVSGVDHDVVPQRDDRVVDRGQERRQITARQIRPPDRAGEGTSPETAWRPCTRAT
jgi:hypothetical protein